MVFIWDNGNGNLKTVASYAGCNEYEILRDGGVAENINDGELNDKNSFRVDLRYMQ